MAEQDAIGLLSPLRVRKMNHFSAFEKSTFQVLYKLQAALSMEAVLFTLIT